MNSTTIQISQETKKRIDGYKKHPRATMDETVKWLLDKLQELDEEIVELNKKLGQKKEEY